MKIGIIGAMEQEVTLLHNKIISNKTLSIAGNKIHTGIINGVNVAILKSGIGKVSTAMHTALLLEYFRPDLVINIGSAGCLTHSLKIGDIVISNEVCYHDVDVTAFGYKLGQMVNCPITFSADETLIGVAEACIHQLNMHMIRGLVVSGDIFINGAESLSRVRTTFPQAIAVDMEAAAIGHVCYQFSIPFVVIRAISDVADQTSHLNFNTFINLAAKQSALLVEAMLGQLLNN